MKRFTMLFSSITLVLALTGVALAQTSDPNAATGAKGQDNAQTSPGNAQTSPGDAQTSPAPTTPPVPVPADVSASTSAKPNPALDAVRQKATKVNAKEKADVEKKVQEVENGVEAEATAKGDATVAGRIAGEFGMSADALVAERTQFGRGWGEILIAHTLAANSKTNITIADLFQMRTEGMGWGQIAHGMDLKMGDLVSAVKAEGKVATGLAKADGKPAVIRGMSAGTGVGAQAGTKVQHGKGGVSASVGAGAATKEHGGK